MSSTTPEQLFTESIAANRALANTIQTVNTEQNTRFNELQTLSGQQFSDQKTQIEQQLADHKKQADDHLNSSTDKVDKKLQEVNNFIKNNDFLGDSDLPGVQRNAIFQGFINNSISGSGSGGFKSQDLASGSNVDRYLHFKTTINVHDQDTMFRFHMVGYSYGSGKIINEIFSGYCQSTSGRILNTDTQGTSNPFIYVGSDGDVFLRVNFYSTYHTTIRIDAMHIQPGKLLKYGDVQGFVSQKSLLL